MRFTTRLSRRIRLMWSFGFALRLGVLASGVLSLWLTVPDLDDWVWYPILLLPAPLLAMSRPDQPFAAWTMGQAVIMLLINGYLVDEISALTAVAVGVTCYLHHSCAAMAALWRTDTDTDPRVWQGWLTRVGGVVVVSAAVAGVVAVVTGQPIEGPPALMAAAAACVVLAVVAAVAWLYHRRADPWDG